MSGHGTDIWVAAATHPSKEGLATLNLQRQGFEAYCPMVRKRTYHARRRQTVHRPLFPGYVFINLDPDRDRWRPIASTLGVRSLIRFGDRLGVLPAKFVEELRAREDSGAISLKCQEHCEPGTIVRLIEGPMQGLIATVLSADDKNRLVVLLQILARSVRVTVDMHSVLPVQPGLQRHSLTFRA